jgi:hypothetical protein
MDKKYHKLNITELGKCPCGEYIGMDENRYAVIHSFPVCDKFDELEPNDFLKYIRQCRGMITDN